MFSQDSYDWGEVFKYGRAPDGVDGYTGSTSRFGIEDVDVVLKSDDGERDESEWVAIFSLKDGRFASIRASCDYTGWG